MKFKNIVLLAVLIIISSIFLGCIGLDSQENTSKEMIDESSIVGVWTQKETNTKLIFLNSYSFKELTDKRNTDGVWRIENNTTLVLNMETWDFSKNSSGEYVGWEDVSFGTIKDGVLVFTSINDEPEIGFPTGEFIPE